MPPYPQRSPSLTFFGLSYLIEIHDVKKYGHNELRIRKMHVSIQNGSHFARWSVPNSSLQEHDACFF